MRNLVSIFFFFSSRRRHTRYWRDWSSDVCSSDLVHLDTAQVAGAEDLHRLAAAHGAGLGEAVGVHRAALGEQGRDPVEVDDLEDDLVPVLEARELGQPHVQRRLPALEARGGVPARAGALGAATGRLALGALTATHAGLGGVGAGGRTQVVDLESHATGPSRP